MNTNIRIDVDTSEVRDYLLKMERRSTDFRSVFRWARRELEEAQRENFASEGAASGRRWASLDDDYARWKLSEYGPLPTLVRTGDLYREVTFFRGPPNEIGLSRATFGTDLPYAGFHQAGTSKMPQRRIIYVPKLFAERMGELVLKYLVYGNETGVSVSRLRSLLRS